MCISDDAHRQVRGKVESTLEDMGSQSLKNIAEPMRVWRIQKNSVSALVSPAYPSSGHAALPLPDGPSIAILAFQNTSGDPDQDYFADGMVDEITTALSRFKSLFVIGRHFAPPLLSKTSRGLSHGCMSCFPPLLLGGSMKDPRT